MRQLPATFTAIPVGQGDAFLLERADGTVILVDGGRARSTFAGQLRSLCPTPSIDVVVCTHADADHAEGIVGLLETSLTGVRQVWLPGRWTERLVQLCEQPSDFLRELHHDVGAAPAVSDLESVGDDAAERPESAIEISTDALEAALGSEERLAPDSLDAAASGHWLRPWIEWPFESEERNTLWFEAVQAAARIRKVARAAHHHGAKIRWFDFEEAKRVGPNGGEVFLAPVNSVELMRPVVHPKLSALRFLMLTLANKESLVFLAPEDGSNSAVIFTADSDLASMRSIAAARTPIVTAPHHGAETNASAYSKIKGALPGGLDPQWVRSDGNYRKRPGATYRSASLKVCTLCRGSSRPKQTVRLVDTSIGWQLQRGICECTC